MRPYLKIVWFSRLAVLLLVTLPLSATVHVVVTTSASSPKPLSTRITLNASVTDTHPGSHDYRFVVALGGINQNYIDFNLGSTFTWVPAGSEGTYSITVTARNTTIES
jgi:hypothetical protein